MTSHLNSHRTTDINPEMLSGVQTGNGTPHDKYNISGIAHARTNIKDDIFRQRRLYIDEAHTALDIFCFAVIYLRHYIRCFSLISLFIVTVLAQKNANIVALTVAITGAKEQSKSFQTCQSMLCPGLIQAEHFSLVFTFSTFVSNR